MKYYVGLLLVPIIAGLVWADLGGSYVLPLEHPALAYATTPARDAVTRLQERINQGQVGLAWDANHGYLPALLKELGVSTTSQVLVFSKTSFQAPRISPKTPRGLYFNDQVALGWVRGGDVLELAAVDPQLGTVFYTLDQEQRARPRLERQDQCLQCHASGATLGVPGLVVRSVHPDRTGMPRFQAGTYVTDHRSPLTQRWGGWYVTGTHGAMRHMGNVVAESNNGIAATDIARGANRTSLREDFDIGAYLTPHSDIVALLVLEHQTRMVNALTRVGFETRMALADMRSLNKALGEPEERMRESTAGRIERLADEVVQHLLFTGEAPLTAAIQGTSGFAEAYQAAGLRDKKGRSLRDLDLHTRLLRYRCSPLIYSEQFDALPEAVRGAVYRRLDAALSGKAAQYDYFPAAERESIQEILRETKKGIPVG